MSEHKNLYITPPKNHHWRQVPCKCGFTPESHPDEMEVYEMEISPMLPKKKVWRCKTCKVVSVLMWVDLGED